MGKIMAFIFIICIVVLGFAVKAVKSQSKENRLVQLYIKQLRQCYNTVERHEPRGICQYSLFDMDNDSVPELFVKTGNCEADYNLTIYGRRQDALRKMFSTYAGHCDWLKGKDYIIKIEAQSGIFQATKIALRNGKIEEEPLFFYNYDISELDGMEKEAIRKLGGNGSRSNKGCKQKIGETASWQNNLT